jgi:hypothetical protein
MAAAADAAAAAAAAAALGLGEESEEESIDADDPPMDEEAIEELRFEFRSSLECVFDYTELSAEVIQDKLSLNELVDLILTWDSDSTLESACNNLIRGARNYAVDDEVPVIRFSMSQDLILYREWVRLRLSRGLGAEAEFFKRKERAFMHNWQRTLKDIKESIRLSAKSESDVLKFDVKDWTKVFKSIDNFFRCRLGMQGVTFDWIYREEVYPKPSVKYPSIVTELKAKLLLEGDHFDEDSAAVYDVIASSTLGTSGYSYVKKFEDKRNGRLALLALKLQFGWEAYDLARSNTANEVIRSATFTGPTRKYTTISKWPSSRTPTTSSPFSASRIRKQGGGPKDKRKKKGGGAGGAGGSLQLHSYSDAEWRALPEAIKTKVHQGCAAEKAAKQAAAAASSAKSDEADKEAEKRGIKFGKGAHA